MSMYRVVWRELWLSFWMGIIPGLIIVISSGHKSYHNFVTTIAPSDGIVLYFFSLLLIQLGIYIRVQYYPKKSITHRDELLNLYSFWGQLGFTLLGLYRIIVGVSILTLGITLYIIKLPQYPFIMIKGGSIIIFFLLGSSLFSNLQTKVTINQRSSS